MTAAIHLVRNPLSPYERETFVVDEGTQIIDWLQEVAPEGFGMPIELYVNQQKVEVQDADRALRDGDVCACLVTPGIFGITAVALKSYLISAAVSLAVGLAVGLIFAPKRPKSQRGPNPVYDIGATNNQARLGEPVPVTYGQVVTTPDFASVPYTFFSATEDDQQFVDQLFCIGCGKFEEITLSDILIGDTRASSFPAGVIQFKQFQLEDGTGNVGNHLGQKGAIQDDLWVTGDFSVLQFNFYEDVYTAPDITDWEFRNDEIRSTTSNSYSVTLTAGSLNTSINRYEVEIRAPIDASITAGVTFNLSGTASNNGQYTCISAIPDYTTGSGTAPDIDYTHVILTCWAPVGLTPVDGAATIDVTLDTVSSQSQTGWYAAQPLSRTVEGIHVDIVAPRGLYKVKSNSGTRVYLPDEYAPDMLIEAEEIDPTTGDIKNDVSAGTGFKLSQNFRMNSRFPDPIRRTVIFQNDHIVTNPTGIAAEWRNRSYVVRMTAKHTFLDNDRYAQTVVWTGLKGIMSDPTPNQVYGDTTLLAVRMRGTNGISQQAQQQLKVRCKRVYDLQDGTSGVSGNPVDVINDIYREENYGFGRPADEVNDTFLTEVRSLWEDESVEFNGVFLQDITGWEALETALLPAVARPAIDAGQLTIVADKKKPVTMFSFNDLSIVRGSYSGNFTIDNTNETDGIEVEYRDPDTFDPAYVRSPFTSTNPQRLVYLGVTDSTYASALAQLYWNRRLYQRHTCSFQTEMQGMVPMVGDKISVATPVLQSGISGMVLGFNGDRVLVDKSLFWEGDNHQIRFIKAGQAPTAWYDVTQGGEPNSATLDTSVTDTLDMSLDRTTTAYEFKADQFGPRQMLITSIQHNGGVNFTINAISYPDDDEDTGDNPLFAGAPGHMILDWDGSPL
jgi:hypothetical protein